MTCPNCGSWNDDTLRFCTNCGSRIQAVYQRVYQPNPHEYELQMLQLANAREQHKRNVGRDGLVWTIIAIVFILLAGAISLIYQLI